MQILYKWICSITTMIALILQNNYMHKKINCQLFHNSVPFVSVKCQIIVANMDLLISIFLYDQFKSWKENRFILHCQHFKYILSFVLHCIIEKIFLKIFRKDTLSLSIILSNVMFMILQTYQKVCFFRLVELCNAVFSFQFWCCSLK